MPYEKEKEQFNLARLLPQPLYVLYRSLHTLQSQLKSGQSLTYLPTYTYQYILTYIYLSTYTYLHILTYIYLPTYTYLHTLTYIHLPTYTYLHILTCIYLPTYTYLHILTYIYLPTFTYLHLLTYQQAVSLIYFCPDISATDSIIARHKSSCVHPLYTEIFLVRKIVNHLFLLTS